jgi:hypothetical protein
MELNRRNSEILMLRDHYLKKGLLNIFNERIWKELRLEIVFCLDNCDDIDNYIFIEN